MNFVIKLVVVFVVAMLVGWMLAASGLFGGSTLVPMFIAILVALLVGEFVASRLNRGGSR